MIPLTTDQKGQIAFLKVQIEARMKGAVVLVPTTPERYDLVLHHQGQYYRAQVKYADADVPNSQGSVRVDLKRRGRVYTEDEIDILLVYIPRIDKVCWLRPSAFHNKTAVCLRLQPANNGQKSGCWMADECIW
jgi:PD-(D/E)XK endonuclease